ncbi:hypothetical protein F5Y10DRAFT_206511 [Nemania abortiva]|nr:hypothetical protein F5Y10DRAFT_206511 [Nemania abortiva]
MDDQHLSLTPPGPLGAHPDLDILAMNLTQPMAGIPGNMAFPQRGHAGKHPFYRWAVGNDAPWHPQNLTAGADDGSDQSMIPDMQDAQFMAHHQQNVVPSEIMAQSDSGYGSYRNHHSIANGSVCDDSFDPNPETQSVMGGSMGGRLLDTSFSISDAMSKDVTTLMSGSWTNHIRIETLKCDECGKEVKTKSELKKHDQRHKKPYKCDVKDCPRNEGFSTPNDLARHKESKHPETTSGNRYVCTFGPCKNKFKSWPRSDNFKCHLKRVHKIANVSSEDLQHYLHRDLPSPDEHQENPRRDIVANISEYPGLTNGQTNIWPSMIGVPDGINSLEPPSDAQEDEDGLSQSSPPRGPVDIHNHRAAPQQGLYQDTTETSLASYSPITSSRAQHNQIPCEPGTPKPTLPSVPEQMQEEYCGEDQVTGANASGFGVMNDSSEPGSRNSPSHSLPGHLLKTDNVTSDPIKPESFPALGTEPFNLDLNNETVMKKLVQCLQNSGVLEQILEPLGFKKDSPEDIVEVTKTEDGPTNQNQTTCHYCPTCSKGFPRRCELKKHEKRHEKPYGCTMENCNKRFGSKNDWKRHENTQHSMLESWKCDEENCETVCDRRENFRAHLEKDHRITDQTKAEAKLEKCRVGRNCEARFWCGYCEKIIEIKEKGHQARNERFDHIGDHVSGRNGAQKEINEWKDPDPSQRSKESSKDGPGHSGHKRKRGDGTNLGNPKKNKMVASQGLVCCRCGDLVTVSQVRCNFPCEHIPCDNCRG